MRLGIGRRRTPVGELLLSPLSDRRNRYILTVVDYATRYPEATALPNIDTETVAEALVDIFCRVGIPSEILTDRGSQFTSDLMKEVSRLLSMKQLTTTPYHPQCNGLVEKFNGTIKRILRKMCEERPKDWDRYLGPAMFAYREAPHASLGFSPFELLTGRTVKGPLAVLKDLWTDEVNDEDVKTTYQYVVDLKDRLERTCQLAQEEGKRSSDRYKKYYNSKAKDRNMKTGEKVLLMLPTNNNKLLMQWQGPYEILEKCGLSDYKINVDGKIRKYHANMLKKYFVRSSATIPDANLVQDVQGLSVLSMECDDENIVFPHCQQKEGVDDVKVSDALNESQKYKATALIKEFQSLMTDVPGKTNVIEYDIKLSTNDPIRSKPYSIPHAVKKTIETEVKSMLDADIIEPSTSSYASPVVLVKKPDESVRFCVDYRKLNQITMFDSEPMTKSDDIFSALGKDKYFTKIDLSKGYWQVPLTTQTKEKTSFVCCAGAYQFKTLPFGMVCASAVFTKMMRKVLSDIPHVDSYIDDVLVHTETWDEHLSVLRDVLTRLRDAGLTARPSKMFVGFPSIEFLGHTVGNGQIAPMSITLEKIHKSARPQTKKQVQSFLGLTGYYRNYIPNYSAVAAPLTDLTKKKMPTRVNWTESEEKSFKHLKSSLSNKPILKLPDFDRTFVLRTDASNKGIGAVLLQEYDGDLFPVSFASRKLLSRERNYSTIERECLAIVWAVKTFYVFLYGKEFLLQTDHKPLTHLNKAKHLNQRILRWSLSLQEYRYTIQDISGIQNHGADYLSRVFEK